MPGGCRHPAEEEERKRLSKPRLLQAPLSDNIFFRRSFTMKTAVICWCLFSIALALPIHHEKDGHVEKDWGIKKSAEVNSDHQGKQAEAAKEKTEQDHSSPAESDKPKEEKEHFSKAESDKPKEEKDHPSNVGSGKTKEDKDSEDKPTSKSTRALKTPKSFALDVREDDQEAQDAENHSAVKELQALLEDFRKQDAENRLADKQLQAPAKGSRMEVQEFIKKFQNSPALYLTEVDQEDAESQPVFKPLQSLAEASQNSPALDLTEVDQENSPASDTREDDQEDAENHPAVKQLQAPAEDSQSAPSSDEAIEKIEPQVSFLTEENTNVAEQQVFDESEPSADVFGDFQDSEEAEV
uniref:myristoylated alanine-rich C-kinase substrate-like isoform X2 n=1 Tax=Podarcis muralis TaxID=64176 RepID=UPI0010A05963|nr:myristoylated alanine-rich C-kinase substrate-like isoform X2 [Podarcis muralis]